MPQALIHPLVPRNYRRRYNAKLTPEQVAEARSRWKPKGPGGIEHEGPSINALATEFGVRYFTMWCALQRATHIQVAA